MITLEEALRIVKAYLNLDQDSSIFVMENETEEFEYGWFFFYQSTDFIEIDGIKVGLGGNAPLIVDRRDGSVHITGTAHPHEKYVEDYIKNVNKGK
jgi:hypothetical protein